MRAVPTLPVLATCVLGQWGVRELSTGCTQPADTRLLARKCTPRGLLREEEGAGPWLPIPVSGRPPGGEEQDPGSPPQRAAFPG